MPTYEQVSSGRTGHYEALQVDYDPARVSYEKLLEVFWRNIDPAGCAAASSATRVRSTARPSSSPTTASARAAEASKAALEKSGKLPGRIVTEILPAGAFYPAEAYHQDYYRKNPTAYAYYRWSCGRDRRLERLWGASPTMISVAACATAALPPLSLRAAGQHVQALDQAEKAMAA